MKSVFYYSCLALLALSACTEKTQVNLVSGTLFEDCESRLARFEIALKANEGGSFNNQIILGSAISDVNGTFKFTYELEDEDEGTGNLILVKSTGFETLIEGIVLNKEFSGSLYRNNISTLAISLSGRRVYAPNDTLYYGVAGNTEDNFKVQPAIGVLDTLKSNALTVNKNEESVQFYYGIGKVDFEKAKTDASFNNKTLTLTGCGNIDTTVIEIN